MNRDSWSQQLRRTRVDRIVSGLSLDEVIRHLTSHARRSSLVDQIAVARHFARNAWLNHDLDRLGLQSLPENRTALDQATPRPTIRRRYRHLIDLTIHSENGGCRITGCASGPDAHQILASLGTPTDPAEEPARHSEGRLRWTYDRIWPAEIGVSGQAPTVRQRMEAVLLHMIQNPMGRVEDDIAATQVLKDHQSGANRRSEIAPMESWLADRAWSPEGGPFDQEAHTTRQIAPPAPSREQPLAERITIGQIVHEPREDLHGDWGGNRRILAQTADASIRLFITEGHNRSTGRPRTADYTRAALWIQGDRSDDLFPQNRIIHQGRVTNAILTTLSERIDAGFGCPGLSLFIAIWHTVTLKDRD